MRRVVVDRLAGSLHSNANRRRLAGAEVAAPARVSPARHLQPYAVSLTETVRRRPKVDLQLQAAVGLLFPSPRLHPEETAAQVR
jgi:hypothetical protein